MADTAPFSIKEVPIFSAGTWHGEKYTTRDLDAMVSAFPHVGFLPPVKLGHGKNQKLLQQQGLPAAGWIEKIYRRGKYLFADIKDIPKKIYKLIQNKAYGPISAEIYFNYSDGEKKKTYPMVLKAIALLGAEIPEVTTIDGMLSMFDENDNEYKVITFAEDKTMSDKDIDIFEKRIAEMSKEAEHKNRLIEKLQKEIKDNQKQSDEMKKFSSDLEAIKADNEILRKKNEEMVMALNSERESRRSEKIKTTVGEYIKNGKLTPAQGPLVEALFRNIPEDKEMTVYYSKDGSQIEEKKSADELIKKFIDAQPTIFSTKELTKSGIRSDDIDAQVQAYCKTHNMDMSKEYTKALREMAAKKLIKEV